jgi:tetratricopeptide (TPR) repeat protein
VLKDLVARYPQDKRGHFDLGLGYATREMWAESEASYQRALGLDPNYGLALNGVAFAYLGLGKPDVAIRYLEKYAAVSPGDPNPFDSLGDLQYRLGHLDLSEAAYRRALALAPDFGSDLWLASLAALREDYETALGWTESAVRHASAETRKSDAYGLRAVFLQLTGRPDAARSAMRQCRDIMASVGRAPIADVLRGWLEYDNQQWAESRKIVENASAVFSRTNARAQPLTSAVFQVLLASVDQAQGKAGALRSKLDELEPVASASPADSWTAAPALRWNVLRLRAAVLAADGKVDEAIALLTPAWPGAIPIWYFEPLTSYYCPLVQDDLARLYVQKQDWDHAIAEYKVLTVIGPEHQNRRLVHPIYHYRLAQVYEKKGMRADAIREYERFLKLWEKAERVRPETADARSRLAGLRRQ